jgi:hypothetical protein
MRWAAAVLTVLLGSLPLFLQASAKSRVAEARGLIIKDSHGVVRGRLGFFDHDTFLTLYDPSQRAQITLTATPHGPLFTLYGAAEKPQATLGLGREGPSLVLLAPDGEKPQARLAATQRGPILSLFDANGQSRAVLQYALQESAAPSAQPSLVLSDTTGKVLFTAP